MIRPVKILEDRNCYRGANFKGSAPLSYNAAYKKISTDSADYIKYVYNYLRNRCKQVAEINVESGKIQQIVNSDEPHIFIMNHTSEQRKDIEAAQFFNALLYREFIYQSKAEVCPRSKILANQGVLSRSKNDGEELKWMGVVPINAGLNGRGSAEQNPSVLKNIILSLIQGKINFFIFPEGALAALPFLPMCYKFQSGVSAIIKQVLDMRDKIKVIPLGFAHNSEQSAIHIGDSVNFSKKDDFYLRVVGDTENAKQVIITEKSKPVGRRNIVPFISGILMQNLMLAARDAKKDLKNSSGEVYTL